MKKPLSVPQRHHALDWLRVIATIAVFFFHCAAPYAAGDWHIKNAQESFAITGWHWFLLIWIMPLLFTVSGASMFFALKSRAPGRFVRDRLKRIFIPLVFGIMALAPPQVYIERLSRGQFDSSFLNFYPHYFEGWYVPFGGSGNFAWMGLHLWYLLVLLLYTLVALPLFLWIRPRLVQLSGFSGRPYTIFLLGLPIALVELLVGNVGPGGWNLLTYPLFLFYGYFLFSWPGGVVLLRRYALSALLSAVVTSVLLLILVFSEGPVPYGQLKTIPQVLLHALSGWLWVMALLGLGYRILDFGNAFLRYANESVLPFYMLHQTIIVVFAYYINNLTVSTGTKYTLLLLACLPAILGCYELIVRRVFLVRYLFGLKVKGGISKRL